MFALTAYGDCRVVGQALGTKRVAPSPGARTTKRFIMTDSLRLLIDHLDTPIGRLALIADVDGRLRAAGFTAGHERMGEQLRNYSRGGAPLLTPVSNPGGLTAAIAAYFEGDFKALESVSVVTVGTKFQRAVWQKLREIPCGETWSYGELAERVGSPGAMRAVGLANGANPICIVVPCHRVIGMNGALVGYAGGLERKRWLLDHERGARPDTPT